MNTHFLTESEVSHRTNISLATLRRWRLENRGPRFHKFGSLVRYGEEDLAEWEGTHLAGGDGASKLQPSRAVVDMRMRSAS